MGGKKIFSVFGVVFFATNNNNNNDKQIANLSTGVVNAKKKIIGSRDLKKLFCLKYLIDFVFFSGNGRHFVFFRVMAAILFFFISLTVN